MGLLSGALALVLSAASFVAGLLVNRRQVLALKEQAADRLMRDARGVSAWCDLDASTAERYMFRVGNTGDQPVYRTVVSVGPTPKHPHPMEIVCLSVPPHDVLDVPVAVEHLGRVGHFPNVPAVSVRFTDPNGIHWLRDSSGRLERQTDGAPNC